MTRDRSVMQDFRHTLDMGEISGCGGDTEKTCQDMLSAGVEWLLRQHKKDRKSGDANMARGGFKNVFGFLAAGSDDEKYLSKVIVYASKGKCTDAMQGIIMQRLREIARIGWAEYCNRKRFIHSKVQSISWSSEDPLVIQSGIEQLVRGTVAELAPDLNEADRGVSPATSLHRELEPVDGTLSLQISDEEIGTTLFFGTYGVDNPGAVKDIVCRLNADLTEDRNHSAYIFELANLHGVKQ